MFTHWILLNYLFLPITVILITTTNLTLSCNPVRVQIASIAERKYADTDSEVFSTDVLLDNAKVQESIFVLRNLWITKQLL
jgi:hypothetical protein